MKFRNKKQTIWYLIIILLFSSCYETMPYVPELSSKKFNMSINGKAVVLDTVNNIALCPVSSFSNFEGVIGCEGFSKIEIDSKHLDRKTSFQFLLENKQSGYEMLLTDDSGIINFDLHFTTLPVVHIRHIEDDIPDEPKIFASFLFVDPGSGEALTEYGGIELRGGSSQSFDKKSYGFKINLNENKDRKALSLFGIELSKSWMLNATYSDKSNSRNKVSFEIWKLIQNDRGTSNTKTLQSAIDSRFVELFVNNEYRGIYNLSNKTDKELIDNSSTNVNVSALFKAENWTKSTRFLGVTETLPDGETWNGWKQKYPETGNNWGPLYNFIDFVANANDSLFAADIAEKLNLDQAIDYYILMNLTMATDNYGKNTIMVLDDIDNSFYVCPWDLDATWGRDWQSKDLKTYNIMIYNLYDRLLKWNGSFRNDLKNRWLQLRAHVLTKENIMLLWRSNLNQLTASNAIQREQDIWPNSVYDLSTEYLYIENWSMARIDFLDSYFKKL